ncbi:MAG: hypothetical protein CVU89_00845 [Firmicutes bacterium HGW-Firmicutes-14]|nr:MAG: hypothetical protein CVU89_00845 [Firmicutes bacterium HGW-Firmicutes-14]
MKPDRMEKRALFLPFLVLGYLETLRRATFYAFGWIGRGQAFTIISVIVLVHVFMEYYQPSRLRKVLTGTSILLYLGFTWFFNWTHHPGELSFAGGILFGLPDFSLGTIGQVYYATFSFFTIGFYGLIVFLVTSYIIERKSISEMLFAGILLLAVEVIASGQGVVTYIVLNFIFCIGLRSQVYFLQMEDDARTRNISGTGFAVNKWVLAAIALTSCLLLVSWIFPAGEAKVDLTAARNNAVIGNSGGGTAAPGGGTYDVFWAKMQSFEIKGDFVPGDNRAVMYVKSPAAAYWRGESADYYTGSGWQNTLDSKQIDCTDIENPYSRNVAVDSLEQVFLLASGVSSETIFSSGIPAYVEIADGKVTSDSGGNFYTGNTKPGVTYRVVSYIPERNELKLKRTSGDYPPEIKRLYLQLPESVPERIGRLAEKLTAHAGNPYDKVKIIEDYISGNYAYDLSVPKVPDGRDVTDYFLFDLKKGYCTYHSTAMAIMLRTIGIPARWVKGFTPGNLNPDLEVYEVAMSDAHSWVEVYFSDYGWLPFEPTPSFVLPGASHWEETVTPEETAAPAGSRTGPDEILAENGKQFPWKPVAVSLALAATFFVVYFLWRTKNVFKLGSGNKIKDTYLSFLNLLARKGYPKNAAQTPFEYAGTLKHKFPEDYRDILCITEAYLNEKYGKKRLSKAESEEVCRTWEKLSDKLQGKSRD